jgi:hypothetical protein
LEKRKIQTLSHSFGFKRRLLELANLSITVLQLSDEELQREQDLRTVMKDNVEPEGTRARVGKYLVSAKETLLYLIGK